MKKIALVTGASSGIGLDAAKRLLSLGYIVYGAARRVELIKSLEDSGGKAVYLDLCDISSIKKCVENIIAQEGRIDLLVNNAGFGMGGAIETVPLEEVKKQFDVNVFGLSEITKAVLPFMRNQHEGRIINVSSMAGRFSTPFMGWYHASKYAVEAFSDALRLEVSSFGIKVILIEPGLIKTDWGLIAAKNLRKYSENTPYEKNASNAASYYEKYYGEGGKISDPSLISKTIVKAAVCKKPKIRYLIGKNSKLFIFLKENFSDSFFDFCAKIAIKLK